MNKIPVNKILIIIALNLLILVIAAGATVLVLNITHKDDKAEAPVAESEAEEWIGLDNADSKDISAAPATPADDNSAGKQETYEGFRQYLNDILIPEFGIFRSPQKGSIRSDDLGAPVDGRWFDPGGMFSATIYDFDKDGDDEMLVILNSKIGSFDVPASDGSSAISLGIYENENGEIYPADSVMFGTIGALYKNENGELNVYGGANRNNDKNIEGIPLYGDEWYGLRYDVSVTESRGTVYLLCESRMWGENFGDGINTNYWALTYHDKALDFSYAYTQINGGSSDFVYGGYEYSNGECVDSQICYSEDEYNEVKADDEYQGMDFDRALAAFFQNHGITVDEEVSRYYPGNDSIFTGNPDVTLLFELKNESIAGDPDAGIYQYRITNRIYGELPEPEEDDESEEFVIPYSSDRYLTEEDLEGLSNEELRIARNEIAARHGRKFKDAALQEYFESRSWYNGTIEADDFNSVIRLSDIEQKNMEFIQSHEK